MNFKSLVAIGLLTTTSIWAQGYFDGETEEATSSASSYQAPATVYEAPAPSYQEATSSSPEVVAGDESLNDFTKLHGRAYNSVGSQGASANVSTKLRSPHTMSGQNLFYIEPTLERGLVSFTSGNTYYLSLENTRTIGLMTAGLSMGNVGFSLDLGLAKVFNTVETGTAPAVETSTSEVAAGDVIGLRFSMGLGDLSLTTHLEWLTTADQTSTESNSTPATESTESFWDLLLEAEVSNSPSAKDLAWAGGLTILRHNLSSKTVTGPTTTDIIDPESHLELVPYFNMSLKVLGNDRARVLLGANSALGIRLFDKVTGTTDGDLEIGLFIAPNIFAEVALTKNWLFFGGASHNLNLLDFTSGGLKSANRSESTIIMLTEQTVASIGTRFQWKSIALEAGLTDAFLSNPFGAFSSGAITGNIGAFIYF